MTGIECVCLSSIHAIHNFVKQNGSIAACATLTIEVKEGANKRNNSGSGVGFLSRTCGDKTNVFLQCDPPVSSQRR